MVRFLRDVRDRLRAWLAEAVAGEELAELRRMRVAMASVSAALGESRDVAEALDYVHAKAVKAPARSLACLQHEMRRRNAPVEPSERLRHSLPSQRRFELIAMAYQLCRAAADNGLHLTIERRPSQPLAMGHVLPFVDVWPVHKRAD